MHFLLYLLLEHYVPRGSSPGLWNWGRENCTRYEQALLTHGYKDDGEPQLNWPSSVHSSATHIFGMVPRLCCGSVAQNPLSHDLLTWGTHLGATNAPSSMRRTPVWASRRISSSLDCRDIAVFSFCKPSLGPTSTMRTSPVRRRALVERHLYWHWDLNFLVPLLIDLVILAMTIKD